MRTAATLTVLFVLLAACADDDGAESGTPAEAEEVTEPDTDEDAEDGEAEDDVEVPAGMNQDLGALGVTACTRWSQTIDDHVENADRDALREDADAVATLSNGIGGNGGADAEVEDAAGRLAAALDDDDVAEFEQATADLTEACWPSS